MEYAFDHVPVRKCDGDRDRHFPQIETAPEAPSVLSTSITHDTGLPTGLILHELLQ